MTDLAVTSPAARSADTVRGSGRVAAGSDPAAASAGASFDDVFGAALGAKSADRDRDRTDRDSDRDDDRSSRRDAPATAPPAVALESQAGVARSASEPDETDATHDAEHDSDASAPSAARATSSDQSTQDTATATDADPAAATDTALPTEASGPAAASPSDDAGTSTVTSTAAPPELTDPTATVDTEHARDGQQAAVDDPRPTDPSPSEPVPDDHAAADAAVDVAAEVSADVVDAAADIVEPVVAPSRIDQSAVRPVAAPTVTRPLDGSIGSQRPTPPGAHSPASTWSTVDAPDLLAQADLQRLTHGGSRLGIDLTTAELGSVRVEALRRAGILHVDLRSDDAATRAVLAQHADDLAGELRSGGLDIDSVDVRAGTEQGTASSGRERSAPRHDTGVDAGLDADTAPATPAPTASPTTPTPRRPSTGIAAGFDARI